jgi:membrane protease YdiL (CAAX protease family)
MTWIYFVLVADQGTGPNPAVMTCYMAGKFIQFCFPGIYVFLTDRPSLRPALPSGRGLLFGLVFGLAVGGAALAIYHGVLKNASFMRETPAKIMAKLHQTGFDSVSGFIAVACFLSIGHALLEEYYWRWFVFGWLKRHLRVWLATALASLGFMAHHVIVLTVFFPGAWQFVTMVLPLSLGIAVGGAVWCWLYQRTGSIYAPWVSHMLIDGAIMLIGYDMVAGMLNGA